MRFFIIIACLLVSSCSGTPDKEPLLGERISLNSFTEKRVGNKVISSSLPSYASYGGITATSINDSGYHWRSGIDLDDDDFYGSASNSIAVADSIIATVNRDGLLQVFARESGSKLAEILLIDKDEESYFLGNVTINQINNHIIVADYNGNITAYDQQAGKVWSINKANNSFVNKPYVVDNVIYISSSQGDAYAFDANSGDQLWYYQGLESNVIYNRSSVASGDDRGLIFMPFNSGEVVALQAIDGQPLWADFVFKVKGFIDDFNAHIVPIYSKKNNILVVASNKQQMVAYNPQSGKKLWTQNISNNIRPILVGDYLFTVDSQHDLLAVNIITGEIYWSKDLPTEIEHTLSTERITWLRPVYAHTTGELHLFGTHGFINVYNARTGEIIRTVQTDQSFISNPVVDQSSIYILSSDYITAYR
jgi:outer membrane protein assembly factor BamB